MSYILINGQRSKALWNYDGKIEAAPGSRIDLACRELVALARERGDSITIEFNGTAITATAGDAPDALLAAWSAEMDRKAEAYRNSDECKSAEVKAAAKQVDREAKLADLLVKAPTKMTLSDADAWKVYLDANSDNYGAAILTYAERWARCMEACLGAGTKIADCAEATSHIADSEGITGAMYGAAVHTLAKCWIHGDELRRWHNLAMQLGKEGEAANLIGATLNPAVLCIASPNSP